ncbi:inorganic anion exchanger [Sesbania bispinosa]|nr:inorganic anion exchanger [Sesbania bispinosa]
MAQRKQPFRFRIPWLQQLFRIVANGLASRTTNTTTWMNNEERCSTDVQRRRGERRLGGDGEKRRERRWERKSFTEGKGRGA